METRLFLQSGDHIAGKEIRVSTHRSAHSQPDGLYDMSGNVAEWCGTGLKIVARRIYWPRPKGSLEGEYAGIRGGAAYSAYGAFNQQTAWRTSFPGGILDPEVHGSPHIGFRVVRRP